MKKIIVSLVILGAGLSASGDQVCGYITGIKANTDEIIANATDKTGKVTLVQAYRVNIPSDIIKRINTAYDRTTAVCVDYLSSSGAYNQLIGVSVGKGPF